MKLKGILSISGKQGLFKLVAQARNSIIVESVDTKKRMPVYATSKISSLEDIAIFTEDEDVPLIDVFKNIYDKEKGGKAIDHKSDAKILHKYFEEVLPNHDKDRVYTRDIKRVLNWYNQLHKHNLVNFEEEEKAEETKEKEEETKENK